MKTLEMDIRGQVCPSSLLLVLREINQNHAALAAGKCCMVVRTDNRTATGTIPSAVHNMGLAARVEKIGGYYQMTIRQHDENGEHD